MMPAMAKDRQQSTIADAGDQLRGGAPVDESSRLRVLLPVTAVYSVLLFSCVALHAATVNSDLWVRLASGRLVLENHVIPRHDPFTFTVFGERWIDHEWVLGAAMYALNNISYELLVIAATITALLPFIMMHRLAAKYRANDWLLLALVFFSALVGWRSYAVRPQLINPLFFVVLVWLIDSRRRTGSSLIWLAVPLTLLWANLQAGFLVSLAVLACWAVAALVERRDRSISLAILAAAATVPLLNAYGPELYRYALGASLGGNVDRALVVEWRSPDFHDYLNLPTLFGMLLLAYFGVRTQDPFRRLVGLGTLAANLTSARFVPFFALSLIYVVGPQLPQIALAKRATLTLRVLIPTTLMLSIAMALSTATNHAPTTRVPVAGLQFLRETAQGSHVYADQSWASYMAWSGWPVFFDTRTHQVFPEELVGDYHKIERTQGDWIAVLDRWRIDYVMMPPDSWLGEALDGLGWPRLFAGDVEVIWKRPSKPLPDDTTKHN